MLCLPQFQRSIRAAALAAALLPLAPLAAAEEEPARTTPPSSPVASSPAAVFRTDAIAVEDERIRAAEVYQDTPVETEIIEAETLEKIPAVNAIDALEAIPGLRITTQVQGQRGAVRIDGLPAEYTELLVNSQRYAGENDETADLGDLLFANLDRIEILRGPQSLRYSARAVGGVVNIITADPPTKGSAVSGLLAVGDQDQVSGELTLGFGTERLGGNITYDYNQSGGFKSPNPNSTDFDDGLASPFGEGSLYRTHDVYGTVIARPLDGIELRTRLGWRIRDDGFALSNGPITSRRENQRWLFSQGVRIDLGESTTAFGTFTFYRDALDSSVGREFELVDDRERLEFGLEHFLEWGGTTHVLTAGIDASSNGIDLREGPVPSTIDNPSLVPAEVEQRFNRLGAYAILESEFSEWVSTEIGIRREYHDQFTPAWLPNAALLIRAYRWDADRSVKLRFSIGRGVRNPSLRDVFQPDTAQNGGSYFLSGSRNLVPEKSWALRGGIEANPTRWLSFTITGFLSETRNLIRAFDSGREIVIGQETIPPNPALCPAIPAFCGTQVEDVTASVFENRNLDDLNSWGIESRIELRPHKRIELQLGYTFNRTKIADSNVLVDELPNSPRHVVNGRLTATAPVTETVLTLRGQWRDRALIERSGTGLVSFSTPAYSNTSIDLDLRILQPLDRWIGLDADAFVDVSNLTDNRVIDSYVVRGRSFLFGIRGRF